MEYCLTKPQGHTRSKILIIQALMCVALDYLNFCLYNTVCDCLKGFANHNKIFFSRPILNILRMSMRYIFKRASLDHDYFN